MLRFSPILVDLSENILKGVEQAAKSSMRLASATQPTPSSRQNDALNLGEGTRLLPHLNDIEAEGAVLVHVRVEDIRCKSYSGGLRRVVLGEDHSQREDSALPGGFVGALQGGRVQNLRT